MKKIKEVKTLNQQNRTQKNVNDVKIEQEVKKEAVKGLINQIGTFLIAASSFLALLGYHFEWLTPDTINALLVVLYAAGGVLYTGYGIYHNHYSGKQAQKQNEKLKKEGLK